MCGLLTPTPTTPKSSAEARTLSTNRTQHPTVSSAGTALGTEKEHLDVRNRRIRALTRLNSQCMWSPGFEGQAGGGQAAVDQVRPVLDLLQLALDDADQAVQVGRGKVDHGPLEQRPDAFRGIEVRRVRGQPVDPQPFLVFRG